MDALPESIQAYQPGREAEMKTSLYILTILAMLLQPGLAPWFSSSVPAGPQAFPAAVQTPAQAVEPLAVEPAEINAILVVNSAADTDDGVCDASHCTLREAIHYAGMGDTINFAASLSGATITLTSSLYIGGNLIIDASALGERVHISGNHSVLVLFVDVGAVASLNFLEIINGGTDGWEGGIFNRGLLTLTNTRLADNALGINNESTLTVNNSIIENNGGLHGWGVYCEGGQVNITGSTIRGNGGETGGGISASSLCPVNVSNSTITANDEGIRNSGTMTLQNVTISDHDGRGVWNRTGGNVTLQNVTITGNSLGLGNDPGSTLNFTNTLVANSYYTYYQDCVNNGTIGINNHNLIEDGTCGAALSGDPLLGPLQINGGNTETHALLAGSLAIDAGDNNACPAADQRGYRRPADGDGNGSAVCDIGAFELSYSLMVNSSADVDDGACSVSHCTLREAISQAVSGTTITFDPSLSGGTITLASTIGIFTNLNIDASALSERMHIRGNNAGSVLSITYNTVSLVHLEITDGGLGGINSYNGYITLRNSRIANNTNAYNGGGIINDAGTLTVIDSTIANNSAAQGGGIFNHYGNITITGSTFQNNTAASGAGGLADISPASTINITNTTFSGNVGGGIYNSGDLNLWNVTISGTTGIGITNNGTLRITNVLVAGSTGADCSNLGTYITNYFNLVEDGTCGELLSGDPLLGPLQDNGGSTLTHALLPGSPAIDSGYYVDCPSTDQRGVTRPKDGNDDGTAECDIGAFELSYELDYGDAPAPYPTLKADNGAGHFLSAGFQLGVLVDVDPNGVSIR